MKKRHKHIAGTVLAASGIIGGGAAANTALIRHAGDQARQYAVDSDAASAAFVQINHIDDSESSNQQYVPVQYLYREAKYVAAQSDASLRVAQKTRDENALALSGLELLALNGGLLSTMKFGSKRRKVGLTLAGIEDATERENAQKEPAPKETFREQYERELAEHMKSFRSRRI